MQSVSGNGGGFEITFGIYFVGGTVYETNWVPVL